MNDSTQLTRARAERLRSPEAERRILACILRDPTILSWADVDECHFVEPVHRSLFAAMRSLERDGVGVDVTTVADALRSAGRLDTLGGDTIIQHVGTVSTTANVDHYIGIVESRRLSREVLDACAGADYAFDSGIEADELAATVMQRLARLDSRTRSDSFLTSDAVVTEIKTILSDLDAGTSPGLPTGIRLLDERTGGLPIGVPTIIGARPSVGKSALAANIAELVSAEGVGVHVFTNEDRVNGWVQRLLAKHSGVTVDSIRSRTLDAQDMKRVMAAADVLRERNRLRIEHAHGYTATQIVRRVRSERRRLGTRLVIVDYLQLVAGTGKRTERVGANVEALGNLAGSDDLAVVILSQLNRDAERENRVPRLSDFRDAGEIEQVGKLMIALHEAKGDTGGDELGLVVLKNHQGPTGHLTVNFDRGVCRIW